MDRGIIIAEESYREMCRRIWEEPLTEEDINKLEETDNES